METKETIFVSQGNKKRLIHAKDGIELADEQLMKTRIIKETWLRLSQSGYSKLVIDDLAGEMGISKKTLYKFFPTKRDLAKMVILEVLKEKASDVNHLIGNKEIAYIEKFKKLIELVGVFAAEVGPMSNDLQKNEPEILAEMLELRERLILANVRDFLQEGVRKGIIRNDISQEIILLIFINSISFIVNPKILAELPYSMKEAFETVIKVIFNGILAEGNQI